MIKSNCLRCGRPLKSKISSQRGYGPSCYKKKMAEIEKRTKGNGEEPGPEENKNEKSE